ERIAFTQSTKHLLDVLAPATPLDDGVENLSIREPFGKGGPVLLRAGRRVQTDLVLSDEEQRLHDVDRNVDRLGDLLGGRRTAEFVLKRAHGSPNSRELGRPVKRKSDSPLLGGERGSYALS